MSEDETMAEKGRMVTEYAKVKEQCIVTLSAIQRRGKDLARIGGYLQNPLPHVQGELLKEDLQLLDWPTLVATVEDYKKLSAERSSLETQLRELGLL